MAPEEEQYRGDKPDPMTPEDPLTASRTLLPRSALEATSSSSETIRELAKALIKAQSQFPEIERTEEVQVRTDKGNYKFKYAPLDKIVKAVRKPLSEAGLCYTHILDEGTYLNTYLIHESGEWLQARHYIAHRGGHMQSLGSGITYMKRYHLSALLGIATEDDDDASINESETPKSAPAGPQKKSAAKKATTKKTAPKPEGQQQGNLMGEDTLTDGQIRIVRRKLQNFSDADAAEFDLVSEFEVEKVEQLPQDRINEVITWLDNNQDSNSTS